MAEPHKITINIDAIYDIALRGLRRTYVFLGLGLNAARRPDFNDFHLDARYTIRFLPEEVNDQTISDFKHNFGIWITANGLRELIESFSSFLSEVHRACLTVEIVQGRLAAAELPKNRDDFNNKNIVDQLSSLAEDFDISCEFLDHIDSLRRVRNCLTHRRGVVGSRDCNDGENLVVKWRGPELLLKEDGKEEAIIMADIDEDIRVEKGSMIGIRFVDKEKTFSAGSNVELREIELLEICQMMYFASSMIRNRFLSVLQEKGIPSREGAP